ncbi:MAG TPA: NADP-dependent isocitrate dehydrogenase, partial [Alphaproteobacteria bacterium]|nr:NADP-dependent isocitrate dehydrogenase [Alphaproteobacteria bacterium]
ASTEISFDNTPDVIAFAQDLERTCIETVEAGHMTKDLATLVGPQQKWLTTETFMDKIIATFELRRKAAA